MAQRRFCSLIMLQKARGFITLCKNELKWYDLSEDVVMEIGCGYTFYCTKAILETFPEVACVLAIDKRSDVLTNEILENELLKNRFRNLIVQFHAIDILDSNALERFKGLIHKIVSKDHLQVISNKETAFQNMYDLLIPGGSAGIFFCLSNPVGLWQSRISMHENWKQYRKDVPLSFYIGNLRKDYYKNMLKNLGFLVVQCQHGYVDRAYVDEEHCLGELMPIGLALLDIPPERMAEFREESVKIFKEIIRHSGDGVMYYHSLELLLMVVKPCSSHDEENN